MKKISNQYLTLNITQPQLNNTSFLHRYVQQTSITGHGAYSIQSEGSIPVSHFIESIRNMRALPFVKERVICCSPHNAADDRGEQGDDKIIVGCSEDLSTIDNGRK